MTAAIHTDRTRLRWLLLAAFALILLLLAPLFAAPVQAQTRPTERPTPRTEREGRRSTRTSKEATPAKRQERATPRRTERTERTAPRRAERTPRQTPPRRTERTTSRTTERTTTRQNPRTGSTTTRTRTRTTERATPRAPRTTPRTPRTTPRTPRTTPRTPRTTPRAQDRRDDRRTGPQRGRQSTSQTDAERRRNDRLGERRRDAREDARRDVRRTDNREERRARERRRAQERRAEMRRERRRYERRYERNWYKRYHRDWYRHHRARTWHHRVDIHWPWVARYQRSWRPRYQYRQVVYVEVGYGSRYRESRIEVQTVYRHRLINASASRAQLDIEIERLELYDDGQFIGEITRIPEHLSHFGATVYRNGEVRFDRDVFVVGDPYSGFELVATRSYGGHVLDHYQAAHGYEAAALDFRNRRATPVRRSRLFRPTGFDGHVPITLLPEDQDWLYDYGYGAPSAHYDDDRGAGFYYDSSAGVGTLGAQPLARTDEQTFTTGGGAQVHLVRESALSRID